jgi:hypothetical protein
MTIEYRVEQKDGEKWSFVDVFASLQQARDCVRHVKSAYDNIPERLKNRPGFHVDGFRILVRFVSGWQTLEEQ